VLPAYSGALPTHLPPPASSGAPLPPASLTSAATDDQARIAALEGTVNQMATNMAELFALLRGPNRASSSSTPPPGQGPTADPTPWVPQTQAPENVEVPVPPTSHTSVVHPFTSPYPPPQAPTAVPLPPATFLSSKHILSAPPPVSIPAPAVAYTAPSMVFLTSNAPAPTHLQATELPPYPQPHAGFSHQAPPPINTTFHEPGTPTHAAQFASPTHFLPEADAEPERRLKRMEEMIRALQASDARPDARYGDCSLFPGMRLPPKFKVPEFKTYKGTTDPRHHLRHYRGKMLQYWEYEEKNGGPHQQRRGVIKEGSRGTVVFQREESERSFSQRRQYGTSGATTIFGESHDRTDHRSYLLSPASTAPTSVDLLFSPIGPTADDLTVIRPLCACPRSTLSTQAPDVENSSTGATEPHFAGLRDEIQRRIDSNRLTFNAVRPPNVQANPFPDHRPSSGPSINMISICVSERDEEAQENPPPFVINYTPEELTVGFTGHVASPAPFVVDVPLGSRTQIARIEETIRSIFSNTISFSDDELPSEGWSHSRALHIVCKCNNYIIGRVMIDNGSALNVCPVTTLKQMNVDLNRVRPSKTAVPAFDGSRREVNGEIDLLIDVGPCSFSIMFQVLDIPNAFSLLLGRPWIHSAGAQLGEPQPVYFGEGLPEDSQVPEIEESLRRLEDHQITSVEPTEEINVGTEEEPHTLKIGTALNPAQRARMIDFLKEYQEIKAPPNELRPMTAPWPFSMWGMDVIGSINPKASNGHMFILVAINYFTKWIEAVTLASVTAKAVARFLRRDVIARYGVPATIITDNAKNLNNKVFSRGAVILSDMDGTENALPVNADAIKKYYP
ncbi:hypothetical protein CRG98_030790, partial [Punica granatum]